MATEVPCALVLLYTLYKIIASKSYIGDSRITTLLYLLLMLAVWAILALLAFAVYSVGVMIVISVLCILSNFGNILFEFGASLLHKTESEQKSDTRSENTDDKDGAKANKAWEKEERGKEREEHRKDQRDHGYHKNPEDIRKARALFGLSSSFSTEELKTSRNRLIRKYHPDNPGGSVEMARLINEYYELLIPYARKT